MDARPSIDIGLHYDLRNPQRRTRAFEDLVAGVIDQVVVAEGLGLNSVWLSEHHFKDDGECPSPLLLAAAIAARTQRVRLGTDLMILPLHHPLRLAEEAAMLAVMSRGRFDLGIGAGYIERDFAAFAQRASRRPSLMEEGIEIIRAAWSGASFSHTGRRWTVPEVAVAPLPLPEHRPRLLIGAFSPPAIERAARLGDGFLAGDQGSIEPYLRAFEALGRPRDEARVATTLWWIVSSDPERTWSRVGAHALYQVNQYIEAGVFGHMAPFTDPAELLARGQYELHDGPSAVTRLQGLLRDVPQLVDVHFFGLLPGEELEGGAERIAHIARTVLPHFTPRPRGS